jgi:CubicO group peptidase (beta-lactamase class C family)
MSGSRARLTALSFAFLCAVVVPAGQSVAPPPNATSRAADPAGFEGFDEYVAGVMREWKVPGVAVGVIRDGKVVLARGFGYRNVEKQMPVTSQTLMAIGSNSKSFTVTLLGILSDEGRLDWDAPVRTYLPDFELKDDVASKLMTPTDLVTHRSGLPRHDSLWYGRAFSRKDLYQRLRYLEPSATFRQRYQYNNLMFMTAGYLIEQITQESWDASIKQRIFTPLGMTHSNTSVRDLAPSADHSLAYMIRDGQVLAVPFRNIDAVAPAGSINSNVDDMLRYVQMHIDQGAFEGKAIISKRFAVRMQSLHSAPALTLDLDAPKYTETGPAGYGLGVGVGSYRGHKLVNHGGGIDGFISSMSWMPDDRLGVVVLSNLGGNNPVPGIIMANAYDRLLGLTQVDGVSRARASIARARQREEDEQRKRAAERVPGTSPSHPLPDYAGAFEHPGYGTVTITPQGAGLSLKIDDFLTPFEHFHYDVFQSVKAADAPWIRGSARIAFTTGSAGKVDSVAIPLEPAVADVVFKRKPTAASSSGAGDPSTRKR